MNDNSEGTPNPLNPGSDLAGAGNDTKNTNTERASDPVQVAAEEQMAEFVAATSGAAGPIAEPAAPIAAEITAVESTVNEATVEESATEPVTVAAAPVADSMPTASVAETVKVESAPVAEPLPHAEPAPAAPAVNTEPVAEPKTAPVTPVAVEAAREVVEPMIGAAPEAAVAQEEVVTATILEEPMHSLDISDFATPTPAATNAVETELTEQPAKKKGKKSKVGVVIAIILLLVAIGCGTAAALMLTVFNNNGSSDRVPVAMSKLLSGDLPQNVVLDGTVNIVNNDTSFVSSFGADNLTIDFTSGMNTNTSDQYANISVTAGLEDDMGTFEFDIDEVHLAEGDLYLRYKGIASALDNYYDGMYGDLPVNDTTNCITDLNGETNCLEPGLSTGGIFGSLGLFEAIEEEWIKIPADEGSEFSNLTDLVSLDSTTQCLIDAAGELGNYDSGFKSKYEANPFITYSTENLKITKKANTLYLLSFDNEKLAGFINSMMTSGFMNELSSCMGGTAIGSNTTVTAAQVSQITAMLPAIYVEINDNNEFTRVYLSMSDSDNNVSITADISISYPASITISEPEEYVDLSQVLSQILSQFYGQEGLFEEMLDTQETVLLQ